MAEEKEEEKKEDKKEEGKEGEEGGGKKKNMTIIIIAVVAVLLVVVIAVFVLMLSGGEEEAEGEAGKDGAKKTEKKVVGKRSKDLLNIGPLYPLKEDVTVNLLNEGGRRYLRCAVSLEMDAPELQAELDAKYDVIRDVIIEVLSSKQIEEIATSEGKQRLKDELVKVINKRLADGQIKNVFFTKFVIQ